MWATISICVASLLLLCTILICICRCCCCRKKKDGDGKKGLKGTVDLNAVKLLGTSYKEKVVSPTLTLIHFVRLPACNLW
jgi:hypothetical protein